MTQKSISGKMPLTPTNPHQTSVGRVDDPPFMTVDQATESDYRYFFEHPDQAQYIREFCPGEFGRRDLPELPPGYRYATLVSVTMRLEGKPVGRFREMMAIGDDW